ARLAAVGVRDVDPQERVRVRPLELDDVASELFVGLHVEDAERVMRLGARRPRREREDADYASEHEGGLAQSASRIRLSHCFSSKLKSMPALPSSVVKLRLFCWHTYSASVQSRWRPYAAVRAIGFVSASGSSIVVCTSSRSGCAKRKRSTMCIFSLCRMPWLPRNVSVVKPTVSTTSVSPSQCPIEWPLNVRSGSSGCSRPSVKICRHCAYASMRIVTLPGVNRTSIGYGCVMIEGMPFGTQFAAGPSSISPRWLAA